MPNMTITRRLDAPRDRVWTVLADFPNIAEWNSGIKTSFATSESVEGVGAKRHCDLAPAGGLEETVKAWEPPSKMVISIDATQKIPIRQGVVTFAMDEVGDRTSMTVDYDYELKYGPLGALMGPMLDKQLRKGFGGFLDDLETAAKG